MPIQILVEPIGGLAIRMRAIHFVAALISVFFLAKDNQDVRFNEKLITCWKQSLCRSDSIAICNPRIDLYCLSKIYKSSFTLQADLIAGRELITARNSVAV